MLLGNKEHFTFQQANILPLRKALTGQFYPVEENRKEQVCSNKDASEGRDENTVTETN